MFKALILPVVLFLGAPAAFASTSADRLEAAKHLPKAVIVRVSKKNDRDVAIVQLNQKVPAGKKVTNLKFQSVALNAESSGLKVTAKNELDAVSSKSSWSFNVGFGLSAGYYNSYYNNYYRGYGGYRPYYYTPSYYQYYPTYSYSGYAYNYRPYYGYSDYDYNYLYCDPDAATYY